MFAWKLHAIARGKVDYQAYISKWYCSDWYFCVNKLTIA